MVKRLNTIDRGTSISIGAGSGENNQGVGSVAIGHSAGKENQAQAAVAIGNNSALEGQKTLSVAIGPSAGREYQNTASVAVGYAAGRFSQNAYSIAIGANAGSNVQQTGSVAVGNDAGRYSQNAYSVAIGYEAGKNGIGSNSIAIGSYSNARDNSIVLNASGTNFHPPETNAFYVKPIRFNGAVTSNLLAWNKSTGEVIDVGNVSVTGVVGTLQAVINNGNQTDTEIEFTTNVHISGTQSNSRVDIGYETGSLNAGLKGVAIGSQAGNNNQGVDTVAIGTNAGQLGQNIYSVAIGTNAGKTGQIQRAVAIGLNAGLTNQQQRAVAIGSDSGKTQQGIAAVAIGNQAGGDNQQAYGIAIGSIAGQDGQNTSAIAIGSNAGSSGQGQECVAVGSHAGNSGQKNKSVAVGYYAGNSQQYQFSVAIGPNAGRFSQNANSVAVGSSAGNSGQKNNSVAIGNQAGETDQGEYSISIGAYSNALSKSIVLNASGTNFHPSGTDGFFVNPIRKIIPTASNMETANVLIHSADYEVINFGLIPSVVMFRDTGSKTSVNSNVNYENCFNGESLSNFNSVSLSFRFIRLGGGVVNSNVIIQFLDSTGSIVNNISSYLNLSNGSYTGSNTDGFYISGNISTTSFAISDLRITPVASGISVFGINIVPLYSNLADNEKYVSGGRTIASGGNTPDQTYGIRIRCPENNPSFTIYDFTVVSNLSK